MGILILNIGRKTGWAIYHKDKTKKITSGTHQYRTFEGFCSFLNDLLYKYDPIENIYCQITSWRDAYYFLKVKTFINMLISYKWVNSKDSCKSVLGCDLGNHKKIINNIKTLGHVPDNIEEACAITTIYYIKNDSSNINKPKKEEYI